MIRRGKDRIGCRSDERGEESEVDRTGNRRWMEGEA